MKDTVSVLSALRQTVISDPEAVLNDPDMMQALMAANERARGENIIDLRGIAMDHLETQLGQLANTHQTVISAAYDNLTGTNQIQRAVLTLLEPDSFEAFLDNLSGALRDVLRVDDLRLVLETKDSAPQTDPRYADVLRVLPEGAVMGALTGGRKMGVRQVTIRQVATPDATIYGAGASQVKSEALLMLDLGAGRLPGLLVLGSTDPAQFNPNQATDLLTFFAGAFERVLRRWLS